MLRATFIRFASVTEWRLSVSDTGLPERTLWVVDDELLVADDYDGDAMVDRELAPIETANMVSSLTTAGNHMPCIDIDLPCRLIESRTPGHFHLYIDREMSRDAYMALLAVMADVGIVEAGYYRASKARGMTFLRRLVTK